MNQERGATAPIRPVLLVEDDADYALLVQIAFLESGVKNPVWIPEDGEAALAYLKGLPPYDDREVHPLPALLLLDPELPGVSGLEVLELLKETGALEEVSVVVLTASVDPRDEARARGLGAADYVVKPTEFGGLATVVRRLPEPWIPDRPRGGFPMPFTGDAEALPRAPPRCAAVRAAAVRTCLRPRKGDPC